MTIRTVAAITALAATTWAQAPSEAPPKPKVLAPPKTSQPKAPVKPKQKPKPKPEVDPSELPDLPAAAEPVPAPTAPVTPAPAAQPPPPSVPEPPRRSRAVETSLAAYMPKVKAALGKGWTAALQPHASEFQPGNVSLTFNINGLGKVTDAKITENSANAAFGKFCEEYVRGIQFDPPPPKALEDGTLEIPFTFWIY